jgi:uncharacterized protein YecA (UPF0149 family)
MYRVLLSEFERQVVYNIYKVLIAYKLNQAAQHKKVGGSPLLELASAAQSNTYSSHQIVKSEKKVGRNEPCPCGSGFKFKRCHGK